MQEYIMAACDLHDKTMVLVIAKNKESAQKRKFPNDPAGRRAMIEELRQRATDADGAEVVFAYEASGQGFGLYDELTDAGIRCYVLAPIHIPRSPKHRLAKNDDRDARAILALMRGHLLAGNDLPNIWIPDPATRDDREVVRARLDAASKFAKVKNQIQSLLKRHEVRRVPGLGQGWTRRFEKWLWSMMRKPDSDDSLIGPNTQIALQSLLRQLESLEDEIAELDKGIAALSKTPRYAKPAQAMMELKGVGPLTTMVFLTEIGDLTRFSNRRQLAGYLGLVPTSDESGQTDDHKGHITHQGPPRVRKVLCQAVWSAIAHDPQMGAAYRRLVRKNPKHRKIAVVATMRRLSIIMWHRGLDVLEPPPRRDAA